MSKETVICFNTIADIIATQASQRPGSPAILGVGRDTLSYTELETLTNTSARALASLGIRSTDRVAIVLPNGPMIATAFLSVVRVAVAAPLNPRLTKAEFAYYLADLDAAAVLVAEPDTTACTQAASDLGIPIVTLSELESSPAGTYTLSIPDTPTHDEPVPDPHDIALVLHTSGTTALPKIVPLSHSNLCRSAHNAARTLALTTSDRCLNVMPLFHIHGLAAALLSSLNSGASVVCTPGFDATRFPAWLDGFLPTWYTAVPTMHQAILKRAELDGVESLRPSSLRFIRSSSASLAPSVTEQLEKQFGVPVVEAYGMTEAAHQMTCNPLPPGTRKPGSVGPSAGPSVRIASSDGVFLTAGEIGEVVIRGSNVTSGYTGMTDRSTAFFPDGWFRTGDQGYLDDDDYLFLTGRLKEIINRGGESIAPREIDEVLLDHAAVLQAVAFSVPDRDLGEEVAAAVVVSDPNVTEGDVREFAAQRLTFSKVPKRVIIVDELPKGPTGKLRRIGVADVLGVTTVHRTPDELTESSTTEMTSTAEAIRALWCDILNLDAIDPDQPFLDVGGDSIAATSLVVQIEGKYGIELPLMEFYDAETIRLQSALIDRILIDHTR